MIFDFLKPKEKRSVLGNGSTGDKVLDGLLRGEDRVSVDQALEIPSVAASLEYISGKIAGLYCRLYKETDGKVEEVQNDPRTRLINDDTKDGFSGYDLKRALIRDYYLYGSAFAYLPKRGNEISRVVFIPCDRITPLLSPSVLDRSVKYIIEGQTVRDFELIRLLRNTRDGAEGTGVVQENGQLLSAAYALLKLDCTMMQTGGSKRGFLKSEQKIADNALKEVRESFEKLYSNRRNGFMVLNKGLDFKEIANTAVEMQLNESKESYFKEICAVFGLSGEAVTGKLSQAEEISVLKTACMPVLDAFEAALNASFLLESEKAAGYYWAFDTEPLLRLDVLTRYKAYTEAVKAGWITKNEIRYKEDYDPIEGLDVVSMSLGDVVYDVNTHEYFTPNMDAVNNLTAKKRKESDTTIGD